MMPKRTTSLVFAAACLTAIAAISAHAQPASTYGATPGYTTPPGPATYGSPPGYTTPQGSAAYGATPGYTTPQGSAAYGATPRYATPPGSATYGATPGYATPQGSAAYGATPGQQPYTPQASPGDVPQSAAARQNVIESRQYDRELETNRAFRQARMRKECDPISDPELRQSCLASFHQDEPSAGSSSSSRAHRSGSGR
jgi:hypothetical protein